MCSQTNPRYTHIDPTPTLRTTANACNTKQGSVTQHQNCTAHPADDATRHTYQPIVAADPLLEHSEPHEPTPSTSNDLSTPTMYVPIIRSHNSH
ncbi:unnamed protein product [Dicrocoelium dendriticum]|nr:unnamed protein product [Dicrocoelium dendriticum]